MTKTSGFSLATLQKVTEYCKKWEVTRPAIAARAKVSARTVDRWFHNQSKNPKVFKAALQLIVERANAQDDYANFLKQSADEAKKELEHLKNVYAA